jgi:hypothetical protein
MRVATGEARVVDTNVRVLGQINSAGDDSIASWNDGGG